MRVTSRKMSPPPPATCAFRPAMSGKASKIPKVVFEYPNAEPGPGSGLAPTHTVEDVVQHLYNVILPARLRFNMDVEGLGPVIAVLAGHDDPRVRTIGLAALPGAGAGLATSPRSSRRVDGGVALDIRISDRRLFKNCADAPSLGARDAVANELLGVHHLVEGPLVDLAGLQRRFPSRSTHPHLPSLRSSRRRCSR